MVHFPKSPNLAIPDNSQLLGIFANCMLTLVWTFWKSMIILMHVFSAQEERWKLWVDRERWRVKGERIHSLTLFFTGGIVDFRRSEFCRDSTIHSMILACHGYNTLTSPLLFNWWDTIYPKGALKKKKNFWPSPIGNGFQLWKNYFFSSFFLIK